MKEDSETKHQRQKSYDKEDNHEEAMQQGGKDLLEAVDRDDGEEGANARDEGDDQVRWRFRAQEMKIGQQRRRRRREATISRQGR